MRLIKTNFGQRSFKLFENFPSKIYSANSQRFNHGNDPVKVHLESCYILQDKGEIVGRFAFYENPHLKFNGKAAASIGSYECIENAESSKILLSYATQLAKEKGYGYLIGPMESSTWNNYRFSLDNKHPNFFMEPFHHIYYNRQFQENGFVEFAYYYSKIDSELRFDEAKINDFENLLASKSATVRTLNKKNMESDLKKIAKLSISGFSSNFLYTSISVDSFLEKYMKLMKYIDPSLVFLVEDSEEKLQAFIFAIQNFSDPSNESIIIKSLVRNQNSSIKGLGGFLVAKVYQTASKRSYKKVIHALMFKENNSVRISNKYSSQLYKSYALYGKKL